MHILVEKKHTESEAAEMMKVIMESNITLFSSLFGIDSFRQYLTFLVNEDPFWEHIKKQIDLARCIGEPPSFKIH